MAFFSGARRGVKCGRLGREVPAFARPGKPPKIGGTSPSHRWTTRFRILLISADARRRADVREVLAASAVAAMVEEADPEKGVSRLASGCFDCGLLDVTGNDDEGLSVLPAVRAAGVPTPVVVLAGDGAPAGEELLEAGASD